MSEDTEKLKELAAEIKTLNKAIDDSSAIVKYTHNAYNEALDAREDLRDKAKELYDKLDAQFLK